MLARVPILEKWEGGSLSVLRQAIIPFTHKKVSTAFEGVKRPGDASHTVNLDSPIRHCASLGMEGNLRLPRADRSWGKGELRERLWLGRTQEFS